MDAKLKAWAEANSVGDIVKGARHLMLFVGRLERRDRERAKDNMVCRCGHRHADHTKSYSIHYTAGFCKVCDCKHFLYDAKGNGYGEKEARSEEPS